jgi:vibriolysin
VDGSSLDFWTSSAGSVDVHYSSGIANLAFTLLSRGGTHPRGKSTIVVPAIGVQKAGQLYYRANRDLLTSSSNYSALKTALQTAASQVYPGDTAVADAVTKSMECVGVGVAQPPPTYTTLTNGVALTGQSASTGANKYYRLVVPSGQTTLTIAISGGTGDADMYVKFGTDPTSSSYDCRPYLSGNAETCTFTNPAAGNWNVMVNAYSSFSGLSITGTYGGGGGGGSTLTNGVATAPYSGSTGTWKCWTLSVPAGQAKVVFNQAGGTGDADMYVKFGSAPTSSSYNCRPYLSGNTETCTINAPAAGTWYACSYAYAAYSNTTMKGTYP